MYKMLKKVIVCGALVLALTVPSASALTLSEPTLEIENQVLNIEGSLTDAKSYANVSVEVYNPDYGPKDIDVTSEDYIEQMKKAIFWMGQVNSSRDMTYELNIDLKDAPPGEYLVRVSAKGSQKPAEATVYYSSPEQQKDIIEQITLAETSADIAGILDMESEDSVAVRTFRFTDSLYFSADPDDTASLLYDYNKENPLDINDTDRFKEILLLCSVADNLSKGNKFDIAGYTSLFAPDEDFLEAYNTKLKDSVKKSFTEGFKGLELKNEADVQTAFSHRVFLSLVNNIQNWSDIKYAIKTFGGHDDIGLDMDYYEECSDKEELAVELAKDAPYSSIEDFDDNLEKEAKKIKSDSKGSSSSGGGGGGKISMTTTPVLPEIPADEFVAKEEKPTEEDKTSFKDLDSALWAKESIEYLAEKGIVSGVDAYTFEPAREIKREEFIKMLVCAFAEVASDAKCSFTDVPEASWFAPYAATAEKLGVLKGYDDGRMGVGETLTRQDIAALAYRMASLKGIDLSGANEDVFPDDSSIAPYAKDAVYAMKAHSVISGMGDGTFAPNSSCTRAQAARIIYGLIKLEGDK